MKKYIFVDVQSKEYENDSLFDIENQNLNRDGTLLPFNRMLKDLQKRGFIVKTAEILEKYDFKDSNNYYLSFGNTKRIKSFNHINFIKKILVQFEPRLIIPKVYQRINEYSNLFDKIYINGLNNENPAKVKNFYWPQPYKDVFYNLDDIDVRMNKCILIAGNRHSYFNNKELYSKRIDITLNLSNKNYIDLYGFGWNDPKFKTMLWPKYFLNKKSLQKIYCGSPISKIETYKKYKFALCVENCSENDYLTEKIFDAFYSGAVPIYLGAKNVDKLVPKNTFIDYRIFNNKDEDLYRYLNSISDNQINDMRLEAINFIKSNSLNFYDSLSKIALDMINNEDL